MAILVSHTHRDHSAGARALARAADAPVIGFGRHATPPGEGDEGGDHAFTPDRTLADGEAVEDAELAPDRPAHPRPFVPAHL